MRYEILESIRTQTEDVLLDQFAFDILKGFSTKPKFISSRYFYDSKGSELFSKIMDLDDYYLSTYEREVFEENKKEIAKALPPQSFKLIELGAGDGRKVFILLEEILKLSKKMTYIPVDISESAVRDLDKKAKDKFPDLDFQGVVGDYFDSMKSVGRKYQDEPKVVFFLGSNIGNFNRSQAIVFLRMIWNSLNHGDYLLISFDLKKSIEKLLNAYNDREGITQAFNLNVLTRVNKELGANFDINKFMHFGTYNPLLGSMESYLISKEKQNVYVNYLKKSFHFKAYEPIHTEYSHKYLTSDIEDLAKETGFLIQQNFFNSSCGYVSSLWKVDKEV